MNIKWKLEIAGKNNQRENWWKKTSNDQLNRKQDECSTNDIESDPSNDSIVETLDAKQQQLW